MAPRRRADQSSAPAAAATGPNHFGVGSCLIDEEEITCIKAGLIGFPLLTLLQSAGSAASARASSSATSAFQLGLDLAGMFIGQRAVSAGIGVDFRAVQSPRAHPEHAQVVGV
jgi:hypothetical protein